MEILRTPLPPGIHFVATPIGAARDITLRALDILASADVIAAEDTRTARHLMQIHGIALGDRPAIAYHEHSAPGVRAKLVDMARQGQSVACVSEAGTPMVSDPGYPLARDAIAAGVAVYAAPGPSAMLAALTVSGLASDRVMFLGFPPSQAGARKKLWAEMAPVQATLVIYESPRRVSKLLVELEEALGTGRPAAVCRELTKRFEEVARGTLGELAERFAAQAVKGEIVVLVGRGGGVSTGPEDLDAALTAALARGSTKDAVAEVAAALNLPRRRVYQAALKLEGKE
ncbi:16S rRNA (cytidine(1402)-2'-O)-methyltransferase [Rhodovulum adriaticum]|uniref:Ribosomal RNA small subunit methyltransferase I n=1 Tax=Rhodovulum adriaticum TaxID=35804 RepID=A0A4R2NXU6_RHOAD|nr:16S rRNA (cytidine(1402)-2'-O)-methyltransferase [Rhodovulum adriaticum]MBK1636218.1 16S rRNA (cytidine(1402)-2'-O)-methyltransferase [Rhodovulum adriaticum]TCP26528.1 16S rRNA (cytidine1402-2'-O)-methyltransferase [Rhodovulum adriaticum]